MLYGWPYVTAHSFRQLCLIIIVILAQSKSTHSARTSGRNNSDTRQRINGFDVVRVTSNEAATANASYSWRQICRQDKLSTIFTKIGVKNQFLLDVRSFYVNNKQLNEYTQVSTWVAFQFIAMHMELHFEFLIAQNLIAFFF